MRKKGLIKKIIMLTSVGRTNTVKLGYIKLGYNEHPVIAIKMNSIGWFQSILAYTFLVLTNKPRL